MKILFLTHSFNSLAQRLYIELVRCGHEVSIEFDINDAVTQQAVELYCPDLIVAPFLKRAIPEEIWRNHTCFVVHPGIIGDRGPSALDWAIMRDLPEWGVTVLQASGEMDAGDIWAAETFPMRLAKKSSLYRNEVLEAAVRAVLAAVERFHSGNHKPTPLDYSRPEVLGRLHAPIKQADRAIDWRRDGTRTILRKIHAADGFPGVLDQLRGDEYYLFDACAEDTLRGSEPGAIIARRNGAICRTTLDGAVWVGHLKRKSDGDLTLKLPAAMALEGQLADIPEAPLDLLSPCTGETYRDIWFEQKNNVGYLHFAFYNGAMSTGQCERLRDAYLAATQRDVRVIVLMGGADFWSNGIHLNCIENAASPADESWRNINAMNDLTRAIAATTGQITIAALQGNAGAGGVFLSLAADHVYAREGVVFNPHYKGMGNLYGSEYWTYLLPRRVGEARAAALTQNRLPVGAPEAQEMGLIDGCFGTNREEFLARVMQIAEELAASPDYSALLREKIVRRECNEQEKPLDAYRAEELQHMKLNFYGFDPSYHVARYNFVYKVPHAWTPLYLARHRRITSSFA
ncbi:hydrogenase maturation protein [Candidatus Ferrigenium straubiae]|jgi:putative two-component system hydrogenase maturation factor HypX/HoxX|uniref:hydrogenase maturation protein n=1 Tax=Candidatus Ferrigenium straubiae TaxID=2919506 RepID=UPI003F4A90FA